MTSSRRRTPLFRRPGIAQDAGVPVHCRQQGVAPAWRNVGMPRFRVDESTDRRYRMESALGPWSTTWTRSEEHTSELQSLMRISYAVFCLKKKKKKNAKISRNEHDRE